MDKKILELAWREMLFVRGFMVAHNISLENLDALIDYLEEKK